MPRLIRRQEVQAKGRREATKEHIRLGTDLTAPIDIFGIIKRARIWLFFEPMPGLLGLYDRTDGSAPGILINKNHPGALQRSTAAHEYGHHVLGHAASSDDERAILRVDDPNADQETSAQAFAAEFLMPMKLVNHTLKRLGLLLEPDQLDAQQAYGLSVALGASFAATVYRLQTLKRLSMRTAARILEERPIDIKAALLGGDTDDLRFIDVWSVGDEQDGQTLFPSIGDRLRVSFHERPSTGYRWRVEEASPELKAVSDRFDGCVDPGMGIGGSGVHSFVFAVESEGRHRLRLVERRGWEAEIRAEKSFSVDLVVRAPETGLADRGPVAYQRQYLLASGF